MDAREYKRMKPMLWAMFAAAIAQTNGTKTASTKADDLIVEFEKRFPVEAEDDER